MQKIASTKKDIRIRRHNKIRTRISGSATRPRIAVSRSNRFLSAQAIDDTLGKTIASVSTRAVKKVGVEGVQEAALLFAEALKKQGIDTAVFDRGGFLYAGKIKQFADALRSAGITF